MYKKSSRICNYLRVKSSVRKFAIWSALSNYQMDKHPNFTLLMFWEENTTIINTVNGRTITWDDQLEGFPDLD